MVMGIIRSSGLPGRGARYSLSPEWCETRRLLERRIPKLREFFRTHDTVTNRDYRDLFDLPRTVALRELGRLVDGEFLQRTGERKGTRYHLAAIPNS